MKKILLSLALATTVGTSSDIFAKPETWYGKLAASPIQFVHHNAYTLNGLITIPIVLSSSSFFYILCTSDDIPLEARNIIPKLHPAVPATMIAAIWAGMTLVGGTLTKSSCKVIMNLFDIPDLNERT
jgi:hypothetical protein